MSTIIASNIPITVSLDKLHEFFSFCGAIKSITPLDKLGMSQEVEVKFESEKALSTALLLNEAELNGTPIHVKEVKKDEPPAYSEGSHVAESDNKVQDATKTGDETYDDISQEEKPKYAIMAQLLAGGYSLSDKVIEKSIKIDKENGISTKFKDFLTNLDSKYIHSSDPDSSASKNISAAQAKLGELQNSFAQSKYQEKLSSYFQKASNLPYGIKVHDFYKNLANDVKEVHEEALRLKGLKKEKGLEDNVASANAGAAINTVN